MLRLLFIVSILVFSLVSAGEFGYSENSSDVNNIQADSALVFEPATGKTFFSLNPNRKIVPASLVKVMTLLVVFEHIEKTKADISADITVAKPQIVIGGRKIGLKPGDKISIEDLIKATAIYSANDAAYELARFVAGSEKKFVGLMNDKAGLLGLKNTKFYHSHGLTKPGEPDQYSCAQDMAQLAGYLCRKYPQILDYTSRRRDTIRQNMDIENTNKLLSMRSDVNGLKTGFVRSSGYCVVATAKQNEVFLVCVVIGAKTENSRFEIADKLLNYGFKKAKSEKIGFR